jgi:SOS regulatory protein LexA
MPSLSDSAGRRLALLVATSAYSDPDLRQLRASERDVSELAAVLGDPRIGCFQVQTRVNLPTTEVHEAIEDFCAELHPDDQLLIYFSCHGILDSKGRLYYATANTRPQRLAATAVASSWLNERLDDCRARRQIIILDCCHSGAFARGTKGDAELALHQRFRPVGRGRVVFTASRSTESAFEGNAISDKVLPSVFTRAIIDGLRSGIADRDKDGLITISDLYRHVYDDVRKVESRQTPELWTYGIEDDLVIAYSIRGAVIEPAPLPEDLRFTLESPRPRVRASGVAELADILRMADPALALAAGQALKKIADNDVPEVAEAARTALADSYVPLAGKIDGIHSDNPKGSSNPNLKIDQDVHREGTPGISYQLSAPQSRSYPPSPHGRPPAKLVQLPAHPVPLSQDLISGKAAIAARSPEAVYVPLVGRISAGSPMLAEEVIEDAFPLSSQLVGSGTLFMLKVAGDSMFSAAILVDDFVVVRQQSSAENGEIVAALFEDEAALRTFKQFDGEGWLVPDDPAEASIPSNRATILGRVVAVLRRVEDGLTWRQRRILQAAQESFHSRGRTPSPEEIGEIVGVSISNIFAELSVLRNKGYLESDIHGRFILMRQPNESENPLLADRTAAAQSFLADETIEGVFPLPRQIVGNGKLFMLRFSGNAMIGAAITDGDFVVVRQDATVGNGNIVAATIEDNLLVRAFVRSGDRVWLMSNNPAYPPVMGDNAIILGRVVAVLRRR